ncbi:hypothetical protein P9990_23545 [Prescottella equi]|uniref:DUF6932 family protein n=1 Tax=Prescottella TaxID=2979332 RepID=UPI002575DAB1|nr:hypothetical protein [Prescottella equi]WJJ11496.1 hypothetical protein P9990_23545 [Prescottella equi]
MSLDVLPDFIAGVDGYEVLPTGRWTCTEQCFIDRFVTDLPDSQRRKEIFDDFTQYRAMQAQAGLVVISYWIDGSFTSGKLNPGDIDVTAVIDGENSAPKPGYEDWMTPMDKWKSLVHPEVGRTLLVDGYSIVKTPDSHPNISAYHQMRGYWDDFWQRSRGTGEAASKGYVEVMF